MSVVPLTMDAVNALLVRFADGVLELTDPHEIAHRACRVVAETLAVERAYWADVDWTTREYVIGHELRALANRLRNLRRDVSSDGEQTP